MEDTQRDSCVCSGNRCHRASRRPLQCSQKYRKTFCQGLCAFSSHSASSQADFATLPPSLLDDIALIPCLYGAKTITIW